MSKTSINTLGINTIGSWKAMTQLVGADRWKSSKENRSGHCDVGIRWFALKREGRGS